MAIPVYTKVYFVDFKGKKLVGTMMSLGQQPSNFGDDVIGQLRAFQEERQQLAKDFRSIMEDSLPPEDAS